MVVESQWIRGKLSVLCPHVLPTGYTEVRGRVPDLLRGRSGPVLPTGPTSRNQTPDVNGRSGGDGGVGYPKVGHQKVSY